MALPVLFALLLAAQVSGERSDHRRSVEAVLDRASKERDLDGAGVVLSALLSDESRLRAAFSMSAALDERSSYILFAGNWGSVADVTWTDRRRWQRIRVESASVTPAMIRSLIRADRYESYFDRRRPRGAATINIFPLFSGASFADDLVEEYVEHLMAESAKPATAIEFPLRGKRADPLIMVTADEVEQDLLCTWQMICGVCDRLDLIRGATTKNWRDRFSDLDHWFQRNRPYMVWDGSKSCIRIDEDAKKLARPTRRASRAISELKPPWLPADQSKTPTSPRD